MGNGNGGSSHKHLTDERFGRRKSCPGGIGDRRHITRQCMLCTIARFRPCTQLKPSATRNARAWCTTRKPTAHLRLHRPGTLSALKALRTELLEPKITEHSGRVFKAIGDGLLAEFPSVVNAVTCAVAIQQSMKEHTANSAIQFRIGINVGDVVVEDGDVFGDGVNVALRIEGLASPGGIALTETARDHLGSRLKLDFTDTGTHSLKNIERPIRVFVTGGTDRSTRSSDTRVTDKPSIAVLPFVNMSGDPEQQYFSDGITEDILTELSRFRALSVIARNSSFRFRGQDVDVVRVGRELKVQYVLEGSVRNRQ
jgi:adenylate cyclase